MTSWAEGLEDRSCTATTLHAPRRAGESAAMRRDVGFDSRFTQITFGASRRQRHRVHPVSGGRGCEPITVLGNIVARGVEFDAMVLWGKTRISEWSSATSLHERGAA